MAATAAKPLFGLYVNAATQYARLVSNCAKVPTTGQDTSVGTKTSSLQSKLNSALPSTPG